MKRTLIIIAATLFSTAAFAGDINESPIRGKGAISAVHNEPAAKIKTGHTTEEINAALRALGRCCEIGTARVLFDDNAGTTTTKSEITQTIKYR